MRCEEARPLIDGYLDGELDFEHNLELESHLEDCAVCAPARRSALELRSAIRQHVPYFRAPRDLENRVHAMLRKQAATEPARQFFLAVVVVTANVMVMARSRSHDPPGPIWFDRNW